MKQRNGLTRLQIRQKQKVLKLKIGTDVITPVSALSTILDYAEKENTDLIIIGTRGNTGFKKVGSNFW